MAAKKNLRSSKTSKMPASTLNLGDLVEIRDSGGMRGQIVEFRGPLGPAGANIYRIRVRRKPKSTFIELREDQLEPVAVEA